MKEIQGWLHKTVMNYVEQINNIQVKNGIKGNVVEIGIHHGKFFIPLAKLNSDGYNIAVDLFENQDENISRSGHGNKDIFLQHCFDHRLQNLRIISKNSMHLSENDFTTGNQKVRFFSVDGGHFTPEVLNDLYLAEKSLHDDGVIIVDDFQHPIWDDVFISTIKYLKENDELEPFLIGGNKLFLCKKKCKLYKNMHQTLSWEQYNNFLRTDYAERQSLKVRTANLLFPDLQYFHENILDEWQPI